MIRLELTHALWMYSAVLGALAVGIWVYTEVSVRRPQRAMGKQYLWHCIICGYSYLDEQSTDLSACPQCGTILSAEDPGARELITASGVPVPAQETGDRTKGNSRRKRPTARRRGPRRRR